MRSAALLVAGALALTGAAACDGGGGEAVPDHACDMLTVEEAGELLGVPANEPAEDSDRSRGTYCRWSSKDSGFDPDASDEDETQPYYVAIEDESGALAVQEFEASKLAAEAKGDFDVVADLGDEAFFGEHNLIVRHGDRVFSVFADGNRKHPVSDREARDIEHRAAELALARLGEPESTADVDKAAECARTRRCSGTRESACLLAEADVTRITGYPVERLDGTARPTSSETGAICTYFLEPTDPNLGGVAGRVEIRYEPDADEAEGAYQRRFDQLLGNERQLLPEFGSQAFFDLAFGEVFVRTDDGRLLQVGYELNDTTDADAPAIEDAMLELTRLTLDEL